MSSSESKKMSSKYLIREFYELCAGGVCQDLLTEEEKKKPPVWGFDGSLAIFLSRNWNMDITYSYMGTTEFFNPITKAEESINAPKYKGGLKLQYSSTKYPATLSLNGRYVDGYEWSSGIYYGNIKPYNIFEIINENSPLSTGHTSKLR